MSFATRALVASLVSAAALSSVHAAEIAVSSVTASSTFYTYNANNLINGNGLSGNLHGGNWETKWLLDGVTTGNLTFDLGGLFKVANTTIWNYGPGCCGEGRSVQDLSISLSTDGVNYTAFGSFVLTKPTTDPFGGETLALGDTTARYVRFDILSNYGEQSYTGLSEVKFNGVTAVPEASSLAYSLIGLATAGLLMRRRSSAR
jgi:hypothetical protein